MFTSDGNIITMFDSETSCDGDSNREDTNLIGKNSWTTMDKILLLFGVLINLGDGVEIYLPGS